MNGIDVGVWVVCVRNKSLSICSNCSYICCNIPLAQFLCVLSTPNFVSIIAELNFVNSLLLKVEAEGTLVVGAMENCSPYHMFSQVVKCPAVCNQCVERKRTINAELLNGTIPSICSLRLEVLQVS
jgi:hypothetical protein